MSLKCGLVGLPNVGKSTIFNALVRKQAATSANYPFCTIDPNHGDALIPDERLDQLAQIANSRAKVPLVLRFVDIAGLVRGASKGQGLGNQFLGAIRQVDAIVNVLRVFEDSDVTHVEGRVDPRADAELIETELMLSDLDWLARKRAGLEKKAKARDKESMALFAMAEKFTAMLDDLKPVRLAKLNDNEQALMHHFDLLSAKPVIYALNVSEKQSEVEQARKLEIAEYCKERGNAYVVVCGQAEEELVGLDAGEAEEFVELLGLHGSALERLTASCFELLDLITFFTVGEKEARAWEIKKQTSADAAAGKIHTDMERGFIAAEVCSFGDYTTCGGEKPARDQGKMRLEGRDYIMQDGDITHFRFNV